jgi:hypothetical protein
VDLSQASTEPFSRFHNFHEEFNRAVKVTFGALELLRNNAAVIGPITSLPAGDEPWGVLPIGKKPSERHTRWRDPSREIRFSTTFISTMGIVRVMSAFEDFLISIEAEYARSSFLRDLTTATPYQSHEDEQTTLQNMCRQLNWDLKTVAFAVPLYEYFYCARNCIVHRSGRASKALVQLAHSQSLAKSQAAWPIRSGKRLPSLPSISSGRDVSWLPRHAILASGVCYVVAKHLNQKLINTIGEPGIVFMAAHHSLLSEERIPMGAKKSPEAAIQFLLGGRYRIKKISAAKTIRILKGMDKWLACRRAYDRLFAANTPKNR